MADSGDDERLLLLLLLFILIAFFSGNVSADTTPRQLILKPKNPRKLQPYNSVILSNENIKQMKLYSLLLYVPV